MLARTRLLAALTTLVALCGLSGSARATSDGHFILAPGQSAYWDGASIGNAVGIDPAVSSHYEYELELTESAWRLRVPAERNSTTTVGMSFLIFGTRPRPIQITRSARRQQVFVRMSLS